jgi:hypothetical protein
LRKSFPASARWKYEADRHPTLFQWTVFSPTWHRSLLYPNGFQLAIVSPRQEIFLKQSEFTTHHAHFKNTDRHPEPPLNERRAVFSAGVRGEGPCACMLFCDRWSRHLCLHSVLALLGFSQWGIKTRIYPYQQPVSCRCDINITFRYGTTHQTHWAIVVS